MSPFSQLDLKVGEGRFEALQMTKPPRIVLIFSILCLLLVGTISAGLIWVPWRQTVIGQGQVAIFDPLDRPQTVDSQVKGILVELKVKEGDSVTKGQHLATVEDRDTKYLDPRLSERVLSQIRALQDKRAATYGRIEALDSQVSAIVGTREAKLASVDAKVAQAGQKLEVARSLIISGEQDVETAKLQEERMTVMEKEGLKSKRDLELAVQKRVEAEAKLEKMKGDLVVDQQEIGLTELDLANVEAEANEKTQKISESKAKAYEDLADIEEKIQKLENELSSVEVRRSLQEIKAPSTGQVVNLKKLGLGQQVKEGDTIATIVPTTQERAVELYLTGLDAPLVEVGVPVRLMFEGFPAVPFVGWEWSSVGTFGGIVAWVDPVVTNDEKNGYRVWVIPDDDQPQWPPQERLRLGAKANGWIMLNQVPMYYELWRQLNAFPAKPATIDNDKKIKTKPVIRR